MAEQHDAQERVEDRSAADSSGGELMLARVQVVYENEDGEAALANYGDSFRAKEEEAAKLAAEGKAEYAYEDEDGNVAADSEKAEQKQAEAAEAEAQERAKALEESEYDDAAFAVGAGGSDSSAGMKGRFAAESNDMPGGTDAEDVQGTYTDDRNAQRERELNENAGVVRDRPGM